MDVLDPKFVKNQGFTHCKRQNEHGGVIVWIFVMVALFAALSFAISDNTRSGLDGLSKQQADLAATEILDYASAIKRAVQELQINGCSDTEINFENPVVVGYTNPNAPSDRSCDVFHPNGGGLRYTKPNENWLDISKSAIAYYGINIFWGHNSVYEFGTAENELLFIINHINKETCLEINNKLGITDPSNEVPNDTTTLAGGSLYTGVFTTGVADPIGDDPGGYLNNKPAFCVQRPDGGNMYQFNKVLIAR